MTPWWTSHLRHLQFSGYTIKSLHRLTRCRQCRSGHIIFRLRLNPSWNLQFGHPVLLISLTEVISRVSPGRLCQFVKLHLVLPTTLHAMLYHFGDWPYHLAGFVIFTQLPLLRTFFIMILLFPILLSVGTCKIARTISDGVEHLFKCCFRLGCCQSRHFSVSHIFLLLPNCCLCIVNSLSCHSGLSIYMILDLFVLLIVASKWGFSSIPQCKLGFES